MANYKDNIIPYILLNNNSYKKGSIKASFTYISGFNTFKYKI